MGRPKKWPPKFKTPLTSIARLSKYPTPLPMVGDPPEARVTDWSQRAKVLYHWAMVAKMDENLERTGTYGF